MNMNGGQDWNDVVIRKKKPTSSQLKDEGAVNAVRALLGAAAGWSDCMSITRQHRAPWQLQRALECTAERESGDDGWSAAAVVTPASFCKLTLLLCCCGVDCRLAELVLVLRP